MTLFQIMTLDSWSKINAEFLRYNNPFLTNFYAISWIIVGSFVFKNLVVSIMGNKPFICFDLIFK